MTGFYEAICRLFEIIDFYKQDWSQIPRDNFFGVQGNHMSPLFATSASSAESAVIVPSAIKILLLTQPNQAGVQPSTHG